MVTTTHAGVLDSEDQANALDPVWHNHYVRLDSDQKNCGNDLAVIDITWESPGTDVTDVVSFELVPVGTDNDGSGGLEPGETEEVCVINIQPAEEVDVKIED